MLSSTEGAEMMLADTLVTTVEVYRVGEGYLLNCLSDGRTNYSELATAAAQSHLPLIASPQSLSSDVAAAIAVPVLMGSRCTSVVVIALRKAEADGVIEIWKPVGRYAEVGLVDGYFGSLARFQNVSSFVRFEYGMGLPGQVWKSGGAIIQDDLPNHPGFLRAAGASAGSLASAVGIPVIGEEFISSVVLINSRELPIASMMRSWVVDDDSRILVVASQACSPTDEHAKPLDHIAVEKSWMRSALKDHEVVWRKDENDRVSIAIPSIVEGCVTGILELSF